MQTQRDHVQAYRFAVNRLLRSITGGDPGPGDGPLRRANLGAMFGAMLAVLLCGVAVLYGLLNPDQNNWRTAGAIVVEKESGTRFVYLSGELHPTANYASTMLIAGGGTATVHYVARSALAGTPHGAMVGIPGAPDALPVPATLLPGEWAWCLRPTAAPLLDLAPAGRTTPMSPTVRVYVTDGADPGNPGYLLWDGKKYPLGGPLARLALGLGDRDPLPAPPAWLATLPSGATLVAATIPDAGATGPTVGGTASTVGTLFQTSAAGSIGYYVVRRDGLAPVSRTESALLAAAPGGRPPVTVSPGAIAAAPSSSDKSLLHRLPDVLSGESFAPLGTVLCVRQSSPGSAGAASGGGSAAVVTASGGSVAGSAGVLVPTGRGMLATTPTVAGGKQTRYLITDAGRKYPLADGAGEALGYSSTSFVVIPDTILRLIPTGVTLSAAAAKRVVSWPSS